jgi:ATP-dependent RNA helicase RhlB
VEEVKQLLYHVSSADKMKLLLGILNREEPESALVFCNTKRYAEIVAKRLRVNGYKCEFIMGDLPQPKRLKIIDDIKAGKLRLLVATDVAARGLDIEGLALVINYDLPNEAENYVHRIGRTARAGKTGKAIALASEQDVYQLPAIERYLGKKIPSETITGDLLLEDKSEGKRIQTDFHEEQEKRKNRSRKTSSPGPRTSSSQAPHQERSRKSETREPEPKRAASPRQRGATPHYKDHEPGKHRVNTKDNLSDAKLSELSQEERMAYYRQKYDKSGLSQVKTEQKKSAPKATAQKETERGEKRRGRAGNRKHGKRSREQTPVNPVPIQNAVQENVHSEDKAKEGLIKRFLGIFKKKED